MDVSVSYFSNNAAKMKRKNNPAAAETPKKINYYLLRTFCTICPRSLLYSNVLCKMGQDFLDIQ